MNAGRASWLRASALVSALLFAVAFFAFKYSWLWHPYFWDEAWSYGRAVHQLARQGLTLNPLLLEPALFRGHPPLFYLLASGCLGVFGASHVVAHGFALTVSLTLAALLWIFTRRHLGDWAAVFLLPVLFLSQPFYALSTRLYPEMLLCLFALLAFWAYLKNNRLGLALMVCAALLTKESGICVPLALGVFHVGRFLPKSARVAAAFWPVLAGTAVALGWYAWQYGVRGWWLFPEHTAALSFQADAVLASIGKKVFSLFVKDGRFLLFLPALLSGFWLVRRGEEKIPELLLPCTWLVGIFSAVYLIFSAFNFESGRYLVVANVPTIAIAYGWLWLGLQRKPYIFVLGLMLYAGSQIKELAYPPSDKETSTGYLALLQVWQEAAAFCEQQQLYKGAFSAPYLAGYALSNPEMGYLTQAKPFTLVTDDRSARYLLFDSTDPKQMENVLPQIPSAVLLWETRRGQHWVKIFEQKE